MSQNPPASTPVPVPDPNDVEPLHPDFVHPTADFIIRSRDKTKFRVHKFLLEQASLLLQSMLSLPQPTSLASVPGPDSLPFIDLPDDSIVLASLFRLIYPVPLPTFDNLDSLETVLLAAEKYDMRGALSTLRRFLLERQYLKKDPVRVYALACHFGWKEEIHLASRFALVFDMYEPSYIQVFATTRLSTQDLFSLFVMRHNRIEGMRSFLDSDDFEANQPAYECPGCGKVLNDVTWGFLKAEILKELYRRPLGDGVFGPDFLRTNAMNAFMAGKCGDCGKACYDRTWTLSKIKERLDALPDCACDSCPE